jgi:DNA-binding response OmpR family regulator
MLIVEDELPLSNCLQDFFRLKGFSVASAFSGEEAVERLSEGGVDVLLLDILLPGLTGLEVLRLAKERYPKVKVIVVTAVDDEGVQDTARRCGADAVISKPFDFSDSTWSRVLAQP